MKLAICGLVLVLACGLVLESSAKPQQTVRQRRRNRNAINQRKIYLARQAAPLGEVQRDQQHPQIEVFEEELPTALTETADYIEPNVQRIGTLGANGQSQSQRFIGGTGFGSLFTNKNQLFSLLVSTSTTTTTSTTTAAPTIAGTGTVSGVISLVPTTATAAKDGVPTAPSAPGGGGGQKQVFFRPIRAGAYGPITIRRRHGQGGLAAQHFGIQRFGGGQLAQVTRNSNGAQVIRIPIPVQISSG